MQASLKTVSLCAVPAFVIGCGGRAVAPAAAPAPSCPPVVAPLTAGPCAVDYTGDGEPDASEFAKRGGSLTKRFDRLLKPASVDTLLVDVRCRVHIHTVQSSLAKPGLATTTTAGTGTGTTADIFLFASSHHPPNFRNASGLPAGWDYTEKTFLHEMAGVVFAAFARKKPAGFRFYSAPPWFVQGAEEYASIVLMTAAGPRRQVANFYLNRVRDHRERVAFVPDVKVEDPYGDGAVVVAFLLRARTLNALLGSSSATLGEAVQGENWTEFDGWLASPNSFEPPK